MAKPSPLLGALIYSIPKNNQSGIYPEMFEALFDILPFEIEGTHSATDKTLVWQTRGREFESWWRKDCMKGDMGEGHVGRSEL